MLEKLKIQNFALIKDLELFPEKGLNIVTGETGAGKSIIINALSLILGKRGDVRFVRNGEKKLIVEGEFSQNQDVSNLLKEKGYGEEEGGLIIRREISSTGKSRAFVNDCPVKLDMLLQIGDKLIDLHGQHDHQSLLNKELHVGILDRYGDIDTTAYSNCYEKFYTIKQKYRQTINRRKERTDRLDLINYHYKEICEIDPQENEDVEIDLELKKLESVEEIKNCGLRVEDITQGAEVSVLEQVERLKEECGKLVVFNSDFDKFNEDLESAYIAIQEFSNSASFFVSSVEFDEERFDYLNERFALLRQIKKRFGPEILDVIKYKQEIELELKEGGSFDDIIEKLEKEVNKAELVLRSEAGKLEVKRKKFAKLFKDEIDREFAEIGLKSAEFMVKFQENNLFLESGTDVVEFYIKTNVGDRFNPLAKTASGGEISRVMLSIKNIISAKEGVNTLVFDEIDTGISGGIAEMVGKKLEKLSQNNQLFVITHLPVIAAKGSTHFFVQKKVENNETKTSIKKLDRDERIAEISKMIGGSTSENARKSVAELLTLD